MATEEREQQTPPESERLGDIQSRRAKPWLLAAIVAVFSAIGIAFGLWIDWMPTQASYQLDEINTLYDVLVIVSVPIFVLVQGYVIYAVWRWRMRKGEEEKDGPPIHGNTRMEVIWTIIPALLMLVLTAYSYIVLKDIEEAPAKGNELQVRVVGEQFAWTFYYPPAEKDGKEVASSQLYLPIDRSVRFTVQSKDVLHDFWIPNWGMKIDAVPGINTFYRVTPTRTGNFPVVCAELCGLGHSVMRQTARVMAAEDFEKWLEEERSGGNEDPVGGGGAAQPSDVDGKTVFTTAEPSCGACHVLADAGTTGETGPNLDESLKGKDAAYIRDAIVEPDKDIAAGFGPGIMPPSYGDTLDPTEIDALVDYLEKAANG